MRGNTSVAMVCLESCRLRGTLCSDPLAGAITGKGRSGGGLCGQTLILPGRVNGFTFTVTCHKIIYNFNCISNWAWKVLSSGEEFWMSTMNRKDISHRLTSFYNHIAKETNTGLQPYLNAFEYILLNSHTNPQEFITFPYKIIKLFKIDSFPYTASK